MLKAISLYFWAMHCRLRPIISEAKTIKKHWAGVLRWWHSKINNGILEGLNSVIQVAKSKARGYKLTRNFKIIACLLARDINLANVNNVYTNLRK